MNKIIYHVFLLMHFSSRLNNKSVCIGLLVLQVTFLPAMQQFDYISFLEKKEQKKEHSIGIPVTINDNPEFLRQNMMRFYEISKANIMHMSEKIWSDFRCNCGLSPFYWQSFVSQINTIRTITQSITIPKDFQQLRASTLPLPLLKNLEDNCNRNGIPFKTINIVDSPHVYHFVLHTPLHPRVNQEFIFVPDTLTINNAHYSKDPHFFNICIAATLHQNIGRIMKLFELILREQISQPTHTEMLRSQGLDFNLIAQNIQQASSLFIKHYGCRIGILSLALKIKGVAAILEKSLQNNSMHYSDYGILEDDLIFFKTIKQYTDCKASLCHLEKSIQPRITEDYNELFEDLNEYFDPVYL